MKVALTIAGSDSSGGAGIQADLRAFAAHKIHGASAVTAVTAQNAAGIAATHAVPPKIVAAQITSVFDYMSVDGVKIGMLGTRATVDAVTKIVKARRLRPVVDPVMMSSGKPLLDDNALNLLVANLFPEATVVTPNRMEAERLSGMTIRTLAEARDASRRIGEIGTTMVVLTGGHLDINSDTVTDVVHDGKNLFEVTTQRIPVGVMQRTHGTGCTYSAALLSALILGHKLPEAAKHAQRCVSDTLQTDHNFSLRHEAAMKP